jgi:hypothetical protein
MRRITGLLTSAIVIVVDLSIPASAGGKQSRSDCKQRIFQKDELFACFMSKDGTFLFSR